jgi:alkylation response protein AidB-like acyl-CoA dehydrogenase
VPHSAPVPSAALLRPATPGVDPGLLAEAVDVRDDASALVRWTGRVAPRLPRPGEGRTVELWSALASVAAADVAAARVLEPHLDALAVLDQAPGRLGLDRLEVDDASTWGVYAAEGPGTRLAAVAVDDGWRLTGVKPWCSLAGTLTHALVTAWVSDDERQLFAVDLRGPHVDAADGPWVARGLAQVVSAAVRFDGAPAVPVGPPGWYLKRPGFAWGGIGVAACWWGGAVGLARALWAALGQREPDQLALAHLGAVDVALQAARAALAEAADLVDAGIDGRPSALLARRVRTTVADTVEEVQRRCAHALGPGPLTTDEDYARRVADLGLYVRQHHAERDQAALGRDLLAVGEQPW